MNIQEGQYLLFDVENIPTEKWPDSSEFPLNIKSLRREVQQTIITDLKQSKNLIVITGFTSLSYLIDTFGNSDYPNLKKIIVVLGYEPNVRGRKHYHIWPLEREIKEYWLKEGLSIISGGSVMNLISKIEEGKIDFNFYDKLHAKIYVNDRTAIMGSSNFSLNGLSKQIEANIRIIRHSEEKKYGNIKLIAENYVENSLPYEKIIDLLRDLIQEVDWKDALARAISEVLEGNWLDEYHTLMAKLQNTQLWPTQRRGLAQAMSILQETSNVLIADPTGAGKTKLCSATILAMKSWLYETGRGDKDNALIVCPPLVINKWQTEFNDLSTINNNQVSTGVLSNSRKLKKEKALKDLSQASILAIDEAHNYLNLNSNRSIAIRKNNADFKLLITATPINKKVDDLLTMVELLDLDNLDDQSFEAYTKLKYKPNLVNDVSIKLLRNFISRFTVRRTKEVINKQIDLEPHLYKNALDKICRFPRQIPKIYSTDESEEDILLMGKIEELCRKLKGVTYLKNIYKPKYELDTEEEIESYFNRRLTAAKSLSIYMIRSRLRSSNMALLEHILGIDEVKKFKEFSIGNKEPNKVKINEIEFLRSRNKTPEISKIFKVLELPSWLTDLNSYQNTCKEEEKIYLEIADLVKHMSGLRELGKAKILLKQLDKHEKIIAFDSTVITLHYLKHLLLAESADLRVLVATGNNKRESEEVLDKFNLKSENKDKIIALCSDKMSEGVDLQLASAVTLLDLPSVIRIVEQRFGRIDRMDTLHKEIELYWPNDSNAFSLSGDRRLVELTEVVDTMWGSNFQPPEELKHKHFKNTENVESLIQEYEDFVSKDLSWEGIHDSFQPILDLKSDKKGLITEEEYEIYRGTKTSVKAKVSFLNTENEWCFFAIRGDKNRTPRWYFLAPGNEKEVFTEFPEICEQLKHNISKKSKRIKWNDKYLKKHLNFLQEKEFELLTPKKRRALEVAEHILNHKLKVKETDENVKELIRKLLLLFHPKKRAIDFDSFAQIWIGILQPYIDAKRTRYKKSKYVYNLNSLKTLAEMKRINFDDGELKSLFERLPVYERIDHKIAACIVGVPSANSNL